MRTYIVIKSRSMEFKNPISVSKGEEVKCIEESNSDGDWAGWVLCKTKDNEGWIPYQIIEREKVVASRPRCPFSARFTWEAANSLRRNIRFRKRI